jgi:acyl carrier protein
LYKYINGKQDSINWYRGRSVEYKEMVALLSAEGEIHKLISKWLQHGQYEKLLQWWVKGGSIDWKLLYTVGVGQEPTPSPLLRRISLPTYPFAQERYWISTVQSTQAKDEVNENGMAANPAGPVEAWRVAISLTPNNRLHGIALRPLSDHPAPISQGGNPSWRTGLAPNTVQISTHEHVGTGLAPALEEELIRSLAQTLYMEESTIDREKPFVEMGLDSVVSVEWIQSLNKQYASNLKASSVYDYPTIRQLAGFLEKDLCKQQQTPLQSLSSLSLDDILQQLQQGTFDVEKADQLVNQVLTQAKKEAY